MLMAKLGTVSSLTLKSKFYNIMINETSSSRVNSKHVLYIVTPTANSFSMYCSTYFTRSYILNQFIYGDVFSTASKWKL